MVKQLKFNQDKHIETKRIKLYRLDEHWKIYVSIFLCLLIITLGGAYSMSSINFILVYGWGVIMGVCLRVFDNEELIKIYEVEGVKVI